MLQEARFSGCGTDAAQGRSKQEQRTTMEAAVMRRILRNNGLSLTLLCFFLVFWLGQALAGWSVFNDEQLEHGSEIVGFASYLTTPHFLEATAENWESEFLQMAAYVTLTAFLFQKGSAESKDPDKPHPTDRAAQPGNWLRWLYSYSLSIAFALLFLASLAVHAISGHDQHNHDQLAHGQPAQSLGDYVAGSQFWFEAFQNWQSEFLSVFSIAVLSIFLRHKGSPESKPVDMANSENQD
jgi:hypothetical protein